jgi:AraC-like DNA-binding protein
MSNDVVPRPEPTPVSTVLAPEERHRVDAAGAGLYRTMHRDSFEDVLHDLRERRANAVVLSLARCDGTSPLALARLVREFPRVPAVALLSDLDARSAQAALALGRVGVSRLVDVRTPHGWRELRSVLANARASDAERQLLALFAEEFVDATPGIRQLFEAVAIGSGRSVTVRDLVTRLPIRPTTLMSRFFRAGLPAPKKYLAYARLVRAAALLENPGLSVAAVAMHLEYSSPQSFNRHLQIFLGISAHDFRATHDAPAMITRYRRDLITPYRDILRRVDPLGGPVGRRGRRPKYLTVAPVRQAA